MSGIYGKGTKGKATKLHAELIRSRGHCENCGSSGPLECAHIVTRQRNATRTDVANAFCLCKGCHWRFTNDPYEWVMWVESKIGAEAYAELQWRSLNSDVKANEAFWQAEVDRLTRLLEGVA